MNWGLMSARGMGFPAGAVVKKRLPNKKARSQEDILEEETATHSSILAWRIPWTEEPGGLQSMESQSRACLSD